MRRLLWFVSLSAALLGLVGIGGCPKRGGQGTEVVIAAAASLRGVMPDLMSLFAKDHEGVRLTASYGASGDLRQQVEAGAPIDVVVFASGKPVDELVKARLADGATRKVVATNQLILIGPKGGRPYTFQTIESVPAGDKIAIGDPKTVPAGQYAQAALQKLGKWDSVQSRLVFAGDVAGVLAYVRRDEVVAGVVYRTETHGIADIVVLDELAADGGPKPEVVAAVTVGSKATSDAKAFVEFLGGAQAKKTFTDYGFGSP